MNSDKDLRLGVNLAEKPSSSTENVDNAPLVEQEARVRRYNQDTKWRRWLAIWVVAVDTCWLIFIAVTTVLKGSGGLSLEQGELIALLCTATANVLGLAFIVLRGLFRVHKD